RLDTAQHAVASVAGKFYVFCRHFITLLGILFLSWTVILRCERSEPRRMSGPGASAVSFEGRYTAISG
ncbi:MAG: hypothetical protein WBW35_14535, partial [Xanthobacteraceae bacterium]